MEQSRLRRLFWWLVDNLPPIVVLALGAYVIYQSQLGTWTADKTLVGILAVLELLAISEFIERHRQIAGIEKAIKEIKTSGGIRGIAAIYENRTELPPLLDDMATCRKEVLVVGLAAVSLTLTFLDALRERAEAGCRLRLLLLNPGRDGQVNPVIEHLSKTLGFDPHEYTNSIRGSLGRIVRMRDSLPKSVQHRIEIRVYDCVPTLVLFGFDANTQNGKLRIDIIPYHVSRSLWPVIELRHDPDSKLYNFFYRSANEMWNNSQNWIPSGSG